LTQLLPLIKETKHEEWSQEVAAWRAEDYHPVADESGRLHPNNIMEILWDMAGESAFYVTDVGQHQMWAAQYIKRVEPGHFLTSGGLGTMGYGYGAAIGAKLGTNDERPVIHITGDGSFHMNMNEACTAVSYNAPVITVILNNSVLGMVRQWQTVFYKGHYSSTAPERKTNYVKVAEGFGAKGYHCETTDDLKAAFAEALKQTGPVWIECVIDRDEKVLPMIPAGGTIDDIMLD
ncbi:MAG: acetolactate synthase large subunit, partial [Lachnospiraceae bacterium]|nr:acetolactate synthase large subunit [Lachnospiraceae bacterium]